MSSQRPGPATKLNAEPREIPDLNKNVGKPARQCCMVSGLAELQKTQALSAAMREKDPPRTR